MLHRRDGARFPPVVTFGIQAEEVNLGFIRSENLVSHGLSVLLANSKWAAMYVPFNCGALYRQVCAFPNHVQSIEFTAGGFVNMAVETNSVALLQFLKKI